MALRLPSRNKKPKPTPRMLDMGKGRFKPKKSKKTPNPHKDSGDKKPSNKVKASIMKDKMKQLGKAGAKGLAMGGQASESLARSEVIKDMRKRQQDKLNRMLERLYGKDEIKPKKKPKKPGNLRFSIPKKQKPGNLKTLKSKPKKPGNLRFSK
tara:strand:+ start:771 stop:1229 length:459 start_codon:yes stop_codon:yes gene_type:complete